MKRDRLENRAFVLGFLLRAIVIGGFFIIVLHS